MEKSNGGKKQIARKLTKIKKWALAHKIATIGLILAGSFVLCATAVFINNNISLTRDSAFEKQLDNAIKKALAWTETHKNEIITQKNIGLIKMLNECDKFKPTPIFTDIVAAFMSTPSHPSCWKRTIDKNWPVNERQLNKTIKAETIDNKWFLYAIAPDKAKISPEKMHMFDPDRWQRRQLTHQLDALTKLREVKGADKQLNQLIDHLTTRLSRQLIFDISVVDIYIQKVLFVLRAGSPKKIRRRWIERIIANQLPDGGWNDRWFFCTSQRRKPNFNLAKTPADQHATLQALALLYHVKYLYPKHFALQ